MKSSRSGNIIIRAPGEKKRKYYIRRVKGVEEQEGEIRKVENCKKANKKMD